jgi:uncharacterized protein YkwD
MKNTKTNITIHKSYLNFTTLVIILSIFTFGYSAQAKENNLENIVLSTNEARAQNGLDELLISPTLNNVANRKAQHMISYGYFSHNSPTGTDPWYWFEEAGYDYKYAGENLAINYETAEKQQAAWMKSPTHRENILNLNYKEIGIATATGYINNKPATITVQIFGTPRNLASKPTIVNRNNKLAKSSKLHSYVLGEQVNIPIQTQYLKQITTPISKSQEASRFIQSNITLNIIKKQSHNLLWVTILILCILVIRNLVLKNITSSATHHPSITNLILIVMLWSVFISF